MISLSLAGETMRLILLALLCAAFSACSSIAPSPSLPIGEFYDHVLDPLATKLANEHIDQSHAELTSGYLSPTLLTLLGSVVYGPVGGTVGGGLATVGNASIDKQMAQVESNRIPLKRAFLDLLSTRTTVKGTAYAVCVQGAERLYGVQDGRFVRLTDGPGPCAITPLSSLLHE